MVQRVVDAEVQRQNTEARKLVRQMDKYPHRFRPATEGGVDSEKPVEERSPPNTFYWATGGKRMHRP
jgi:hypothetical protein